MKRFSIQYRPISIALAVLLLIVQTSCTVQQRKYRPGLDVRWNNSPTKPIMQSEKIKSVDGSFQENSPVAETNFTKEISSNKQSQIQPIVDSAKQAFIKIRKKQNKIIERQQITSRDTAIAKSNPNGKSIEHPRARSSMFLAASAFGALLLVVGLAAWLPLLFAVAVGYAIAASIGAIMNGMRAKKEIAASSGTYSGKGLASVGIVIGWLMLLVMFLALVLLALVILALGGL